MLIFLFAVEIPETINKNALLAITALHNVKKNNITKVNNFKICKDKLSHFSKNI